MSNSPYYTPSFYACSPTFPITYISACLSVNSSPASSSASHSPACGSTPSSRSSIEHRETASIIEEERRKEAIADAIARLASSNKSKTRNPKRVASKKKRVTYIYILECADETYYVGKTKNLERRLDQHFSGEGSVWTTLHPPIKLLESHRSTGFADENITTLRTMEKYGIINVRGGDFCYTKIGKKRLTYLTERIEILNSGTYDGIEPKYNKRKKKMTRPSIVTTQTKPKVFKKVTRGATCQRCGRKNHKKVNCYAFTHIDGTTLAETCERCGRKGHSQDECYATTTNKGKKLK